MRSLITLFAIPILIAVAAGCGEEAHSSVVELQLTAPGMHCSGCTSTVEETLGKMQGVDSVYADLDSKGVYVLVDTLQTNRSALVEMIARLGFAEAQPEDMPTSDQPAPAEAPMQENAQ